MGKRRKQLHPDVLVIDELGYLNARPEQSNIFFKLMEERYRRKSTIITTNLDYEQWHGFLGNKSLVDALLGRVRHQCHTVTINGPSTVQVGNTLTLTAISVLLVTVAGEPVRTVPVAESSR